MTELTDEEKQLVRSMLNSMEPETVNLMALDRKYDKQWYAEQLQHLRRMDEYFKELAQVLKMCDRTDAKHAIIEHRRHLNNMIEMYEVALKDLKDNDRQYELR